MAIGIAWVVYRFIVYHRAEQRRAGESDLLFSEEQLRAYIEELKKQKSEKDLPASGQQSSDTSIKSVPNPDKAHTPDGETPPS